MDWRQAADGSDERQRAIRQIAGPLPARFLRACVEVLRREIGTLRAQELWAEAVTAGCVGWEDGSGVSPELPLLEICTDADHEQARRAMGRDFAAFLFDAVQLLDDPGEEQAWRAMPYDAKRRVGDHAASSAAAKLGAALTATARKEHDDRIYRDNKRQHGKALDTSRERAQRSLATVADYTTFVDARFR